MPRFLRRNSTRWSVAAVGALSGTVALALLVAIGSADRTASPAVAESAPADPGTPDRNGTETPGTAALRIAIDPETGELVPVLSVPEAKAMDAELEHLLSRSSEGLTQEVLPDGSVMVDLQGRFQNASLATIDEDGELRTTCTNSADDAAHLLSCPHHGATAQPADGHRSSRPVEVK